MRSSFYFRFHTSYFCCHIDFHIIFIYFIYLMHFIPNDQNKFLHLINRLVRQGKRLGLRPKRSISTLSRQNEHSFSFFSTTLFFQERCRTSRLHDGCFLLDPIVKTGLFFGNFKSDCFNFPFFFSTYTFFTITRSTQLPPVSI